MSACSIQVERPGTSGRVKMNIPHFESYVSLCGVHYISRGVLDTGFEPLRDLALPCPRLLSKPTTADMLEFDRFVVGLSIPVCIYVWHSVICDLDSLIRYPFSYPPRFESCALCIDTQKSLHMRGDGELFPAPIMIILISRSSFLFSMNMINM